ncbi:hypothetical protein LCGC14_0394210 [marine sediment metagenome]|uniref:Peptidase M15A C-terminal domain-containing protein n=1 Tax=marine sediment metagenome TaxID=412755 RepID=A0A0F9VKQ0_9ZZZZ
MTYLEFCLAIRELQMSARFSVTSWWRSPERNKKVGGVGNSWHLCGRGLDVIPDTDEDRAEILRLAPILDLEVINEGDHLHLEPKK